MAVKIVRQPNKIALLGAPTSAAAMSAGHEGAPSALRSAGLVDRLSSIGYQVNDLGDDAAEVYKPDDESPRARNISAVIRAIEALKPRVEQAVKSFALPLILSGDCSVALATVAGVRRYFRNVGMIYIDRDADLNTPATTPSGCVDGMVVSHLTGRGAAELVRFWSEPPLVREPDLALFGVDRLDPSEDETLRRSSLQRYLADDVKRMGVASAAKAVTERIHGSGYEFVLHLDVDVIADFQATNYPGSGGLTLDEVREALEVFVLRKNLAAIEVTAFNPAKDADGNGARIVVDLIVGALEKRFNAMKDETGPVAAGAVPAGASAPSTTPAERATNAEPETEQSAPSVHPGEAGSSDSLEDDLSAGTEEGGTHEASPAPIASPEGASESSDESGASREDALESSEPPDSSDSGHDRDDPSA